jgi:surface polysaccharide O-acyltransferase-like enzyme
MKHEIDNNRLYWIDAIRSFACLCVITVHAAVPGGTKGQYMIGPINYFTASGASILFFMISGALVLYRPKPFVPFIKQRLLRIFLPMAVWSIVGLLIYCFEGKMLWSELPKKILLIPIWDVLIYI